MNRINAIYVRQSVDKKDSISIDSQVEFCEYELKGESSKVYKDKGYSGKNTDRPAFKDLMRDIQNGLISKVVVYKLDRISRSIMDFANMMGLFQECNVEFVSSTEKFDTSTPMGRAMLNICIVFAQLERETIQQRIRDAYYSRSTKGFYASGKAPYGYKLKPTVIDGMRTKMLAPDANAEAVKLMYEMYSQPETSIGEIVRYFTEQGITLRDSSPRTSAISNLIRNPVYVQADLDIYEFFKNQGANIINEAADFVGGNSCYLYQGKNALEKKQTDLKDQMLVLAPHEGLVDSGTWLKCRRKLLNNTAVAPSLPRKAKNTWLAGKIKCGRCGSALVAKQYFRCRTRAENKSCEGCGTLRTHEVEDFVYQEMYQKMSEFRSLTSGTPSKANPKLTALRVELERVEVEIEKLLDTLADATPTLLSYANTRIEKLDERRQDAIRRIADMTSETMTAEQVNRITDYLERWDDIGFDDRRLVVDGLVTRILATKESIKFEWKI